MQSVQVLTGAWYGDREVDLTFPDDWDINVIAYEKHPVLTQDQLRQAFHEPIGSPRIAEIAQRSKQRCHHLRRFNPSNPLLRGNPLYPRGASGGRYLRRKHHFLHGLRLSQKHEACGPSEEIG